MSPEEFIPVAEETGLILSLGEWVLDASCRQLAEWQDRFDPKLQMSVNLSVRQFQDPDLTTKISDAIKRHGVTPDTLILEITESMLAGNTEQFVEKLHEIRSLGARIAIDDFGTGYSSFKYLQQLPINELKIDKSFVSGIDAGPTESAISRAIIKVADTLGLTVVAEGVERESQRSLLERWGCHLAQGFLLAKPLDETDAELLLMDQQLTVRRTS